MENRSALAELRIEIELLEVQQALEREVLVEQFYQTYESLKPVNLLKNSLSQVISSPFLIDNILGTAVGLASGYLSKKIVVGASGNIFRKLLGFIIQLGVTGSVSQQPDSIKSIGHYIYQHLLHKKER